MRNTRTIIQHNMKILKLSSLLLLLGLMPLLQACIADEELSNECDILEVSADWLNEQPEGFIMGAPAIVSSNPAKVTLRVDPSKGNVHEMAPRFVVSDGAKLYYNDNGELKNYYPAAVHDFTTPQTYSVKSQDGKFIKNYTVALDPLGMTFVDNPAPFTQDFESFAFYDALQSYQVLSQPRSDGSGNYESFWTSGNGGFKLTGMANDYTDYPTTFVQEGRNGGYCAKLITRDAGIFGIHTTPKMPIAAGNLFVGDFLLNNAMRAPRQATRFGLQVAQGKPLTIEGYYKYTPGPEVVNGQKEVIPGKVDKADIYAVLYELDPYNIVTLDGDNILSSDRIVLLARIDDPGQPADWTYFSEPFREMNGKTFSFDRLRQYGYGFAIVMTSSREGAYFEGAIGSTLWVDDIQVNWQYPEN